MKICSCGARFARMPAPPRVLRDGSTIDPNSMCPSCEHNLAKEAAEYYVKNADVISARSKYTNAEIALMERECVRKEPFFDVKLAMKIGAKARKRHRGKNPVTYYRCQVKVDPILYPDRAKRHWHLGGDCKRKI